MPNIDIADAEGALEKVKELQEIYDEIAKTEIPDSVREAREQGWQVVPRGIEINGLKVYDLDDLQKDGSRAISLPVALRLIEEFEDELISSTVMDPKVIFVNKIRFTIGLVQGAFDGIGLLWDIAKDEISAWSLLELIAWLHRFFFNPLEAVSGFPQRLAALSEHVYELARRYFHLVISSLLAAFAVPVFSGHVIAVQNIRERFAKRARSAALPQSDGQRYWRRRVSRL